MTKEEKNNLKNPPSDRRIDQILFENRILFISEEINSKSASKCIEHLIALDLTSHEPITILLNSPGGEVSSGLAIYDTIRALKSPVRIVVCGLAASIASIILVSVPREYRWSLKHSRFLLHQPLIAGVTQGPAIDLEITAQQILKIRELITEIYEQTTLVTREQISKDIERDFWLNSEEALSYGLIGRIIYDKTPWSNLTSS